MGLSKILAFLKIRFDLGSIFLTMANFILLIVATSTKFTDMLRLNKIPHIDLYFTLIMIPVAFILMLLAGQILIWMHYMENYANEQNMRNPAYTKIFKDLEDIKEKLKISNDVETKTQTKSI